MLLMLISCKSIETKRVKKDIIGVNEQLYELEKAQIKTDENIKRLSKKIKTDKKKKSDYNFKDKQTLYSSGYKLFIQEDYSKAIKVLKKIVINFSDNTLIDNTLFWLAESYLKLNNFEQALNYYKTLYRYFPFSEKADYSLYKIGYIYYTKKDYAKATIAFSRILREYPLSDFKKSAVAYKKKMKKNRRKK